MSNSPSFDDAAVLEFFETSTRNLLDAEAAAGVRHHVALSIVGTERLPDSGYITAKVAQEKLIKSSSIPYSIVHATQFFEFVTRIADDATDGDTVRLPHGAHPADGRGRCCRRGVHASRRRPLNGTVDIGGPEPLRLRELRSVKGLRRGRSTARGRHRSCRLGTSALELGERILVPDDGAHLGTTRFDEWLGPHAHRG